MSLTLRARSSSLVAVLSWVPSFLKMAPVPSSLTVAVPTSLVPAVLVAVSVKVSPLSMAASCSGERAVRTSSVPVLSRAMVPLV